MQTILNLQEIVDNFNASLKPEFLKQNALSKIELEELKKEYSDLDLENWEKGNHILNIHSFQDFLKKLILVAQSSNNPVQQAKDFCSEITNEENLFYATCAVRCWNKFQIYFLLNSKNSETINVLNKNVTTSLDRVIPEASSFRIGSDEMNELKLHTKFYMNKVEDALKNVIDNEDTYPVRLMSTISFDQLLRIFSEMAESKIFGTDLKNKPELLINWMYYAFKFQLPRPKINNSFQQLPWKKPLTALIEFIYEMSNACIINATTKTNTEIRGIIFWMKTFFKIKFKEETVFTYFKKIRNKKILPHHFHISYVNGELDFKVHS